MRVLIPVLIIVPALEIGLLMLSGQKFGIGVTILLIILTGVLGAYLAKQQGLEVIHQARRQLERGVPPGDVLLDGICVFAGGLLLLTPGFITDITGLLLLLPPTRKIVKVFLKKLIKHWIDKKTITIIH